MIEESLAVPFTTTVLGVDVSVVGVDLAEDGRVVARCARGAVRQDIGILDLPLARRTNAQLSSCSNGQSPRLPLTGPIAETEST
jgi:hypothetical protein